MISYFPDPYKDELYYSILARYHYHTGNTGLLQTMNELLGKYIKVNFELPKGVDYLTSKVQIFSEDYTRDYFINNHTVIPFVKPFKTESWNKKLETDNFERTSVSLFRTKKGDVSSKEYLYYCSLCIDEQIREFGESYWNRIHQVPGVYVCTKHKLPLINYPVKLSDLRRMDFILPSNIHNIKFTPIIKSEIYECLFKLAIDVEYILKKNFGFLPEEYFIQKYEALLGNKGLLYPFSQRKKKLNKLIVDNYPKDFLDILDSSIDIADNNSWSPTMAGIYKINNLHPIRHILLMQLLCGSANEFFETEFTYEPFGRGPWTCMNPLSTHYLKSVVKNVDININKYDGKIYGVMKCDCGYEYRLREWESSPLEVNNFGVRVENRGEMWLRKFKRLIDDNKTMKEISEITKMSWDTIVRRKEEISKLDDNNERESIEVNEIAINYRKEYSKLREQYPGLSRTELGRIDLSTYNWLIRNDREWYESNSPEAKSPKGIRKKIDYSSDDANILNKAKLLISSWPVYEKNLNKFVRKSKWRLLELLKIRKNDEFLKTYYPNTVKFLKENIETADDFYKRKINFFLESKFKNEKVSVRKIIRVNNLGGIRVGSKQWELIEQLVEIHNKGL